MNWKYCGGKWSRLNSRDYSSFFFTVQRKTTKTSIWLMSRTRCEMITFKTQFRSTDKKHL